MSKTTRVRTPSDRQHDKQSEKAHRSISNILFITLAKIVFENIRCSVSEIVGVFVNTLTADEKYSLRNRDNLPQPIQLQLPEKQKFF